MVAANSGQNYEVLLPEIVKLLSGADILTKKLAHDFITNYDHQEDVLQLAVNSLLKDCRNGNPTVRGLAIKTVTSFPQVCI